VTAQSKPLPGLLPLSLRRMQAYGAAESIYHMTGRIPSRRVVWPYVVTIATGCSLLAMAILR
jgi:hypothetical protein